MTLTLDQAGRVELPKPVLERLGLVPGAELEMQVQADGELRLRAKQTENALVMVNGVLIHRGHAAADLDWNGTVEREREDRLRGLAG